MVNETAAVTGVAAAVSATEVTAIEKSHKTALASMNLTTAQTGSIVKDDGTIDTTLAAAVSATEFGYLATQLSAQEKLLANANAVGDASAAKTAAANIAALNAVMGASSATAAVAKKSTTSTYTRFLLGINGSTVADNGMSFGAYMQIRTTNGPNGANGARAHMKYGDITLYGGNIPGPLQSMPNVYTKTVGFSGGTYQGLVTGTDKLAYSQTGAGANGLQMDYSNGDFTIKMAHEPANDVNQAMASYSMNGLTVAVGGQFSKVSAEDSTIVSLGYNFGDVSFGFASSEQDKIRHSSLSAQGSIAPGVTLSGYITDKEKEANNGWGLGIAYDLGGGAKFAAGYEGRFDKTNYAEAGFHFNF